MKKFITALLLSIGLMAMQSASAATLTLDNPSAGVTLNGDNTGFSSSAGRHTFNLNIIGNSGELVDIMFSLTGGGLVFNGGVDPQGVSPGIYPVEVFGRSTFTVGIEPSDVGGEIPVPAAVWLFGSAMLGLFGVRHRKTTSAIAA